MTGPKISYAAKFGLRHNDEVMGKLMSLMKGEVRSDG